MRWALDERIAAASLPVCDLPLCQVRLQDDARWPWLVLVPRQPGLVELEDLAPADRARLTEEVVAAGAAVRAVGAAAGLPVDKLNLGALGMIVPQLHLHLVGRRRTGDPAGSGPVWGCGLPAPWPADRREALREAARAALG